MAVQLESGAHFNRDAAPPAFPLTVTCWVQINTWPVADPGYRWSNIVYFGATSNSGMRELYIDTSGIQNVYAFSHDIGDVAETTVVGEEIWVFLAITIDANDFLNLYWRFEDDDVLSSASGDSGETYTPERIMLGRTPATSSSQITLEGSLAFVRVFDSELTEAQVLAESESETAVLTAWADWPMSDTTGDDVSGNDRDLTPVEDGGTFTVVGDPQVTEPPNTGFGVFTLELNLEGEGTGDYSATGQYNLGLEFQGAGIAPAIPEGTGQYNLDLAMSGTGATLYQGSGAFDLGLNMFGPIPRGTIVVENVDIPGVSENLPYDIEVRLTLVDSNKREIRGYFIDPTTGDSTVVPDHRFFLNPVTSQWSLPFLSTDNITPQGSLYRRMLLIGKSIVATDYFEVPDFLESPLALPDLVTSTEETMTLLTEPSFKTDSNFTTTESTPEIIPGWDSITVTVPHGIWVVEAMGHITSEVGGNCALAIFYDDGSGAQELLHDADGFREGLIIVEEHPKMVLPNPLFDFTPGQEITFDMRLFTTTATDATIIAGDFLGQPVVNTLMAYRMRGPAS